MKKFKIFFAAMMVLLSAGMVSAQTLTVKGTVTDSSTGEAVPYASVSVKGTMNGTATDDNGQYSIKISTKDAVLVFSFVGYATTEIPVNGKSVVNCALEVDSNVLDDVVVVAFGAKRKQDLVGSVSSVKSSILANTQATSISSALEGTVAGMQVITSSGQPGSDASIVLRGIGSLSGNNSALIVVDGVPFNGRLSDINPSDIASINVSKDAVSNSLYGSRAAGGVVMIQTKTGANSKFSINFNGNWGVTQRAYKDYDMVTDQGEFYRLTWYGLRNTLWAGGATIEDAALQASQDLLGELGGYNSFIIPDGEYLVTPDGKLNANAKLRYNDSFADAMFRNTLRQEYNVSASGGNDKTNYYVSIGYLDNDSYVVGSDYNRFTTRANVNSQLKSWIRVGMNVGYSKATSNGVLEDTGKASNPFETARGWAPIYPVHAYDAEGNMKYNADGSPMYDSGMGETDGTTKRPTATNQNLICNLYEDIRRTEYNNFTSRSYVEFRFLKNFTFTANYSYDYTNAASTTYYTPTIGDGMSFNGRGTKGSYNTSTMNLNQILAYENIFDGNHSISAKIGHEYYSYDYSAFAGQKTNFFDPSNPELINGGQMQYIESYTLDHNIEGYFGMADYNYNNTYYLSAAFRRDGTSRFLNRWGNFWSVGGAWRISAEPFMENTRNWLSDLKLRASYGTQGNEDIPTAGYTPYADQYEVTWDGKELGYTQTFYGNPNLSWEKQNTFDVGVDFSFINRIRGSFEYYYRRTDDMLFRLPLPDTGGRPYNWENIGAMENQGVEFQLDFDILKRRDLNWTVSLVGSSYKNKLLTLPELYRAGGITSGNFNRREGKSIYEYYIYMFAGMDENGNSLWYTDELDGEGVPTGNKITTDDYSQATKYFIGKSALPDFSGGLNTSFYYKGLDISIATAFQIGGWAYDSEYLSGMGSTYYVGHNKDLWKTFNPETGEGTLPIWNANNSSNSYTQTSDAHLVSASYFNIRNITVGYTFPQKWMRKVQIEKLRVYFTADNLALFSARQGFDPRVSMSGSNSSFGGYTPLRTLSCGINLTF